MRQFSFAGGSLPLGEKTYVMGILNVTPDSFSDGGLFETPAAAAAKAAALEQQGADMIDIGACSTRPDGVRVSEEAELSRIRAVFDSVRAAVAVPVSVDTYRPAVADYALRRGANIINDVSGGVSPEMAALIKEYDAGWVLMHAGGAQARTADVLDYPNGVTADVQAFFDRALEITARCGLRPEQICLDPGFGFAKTEAQNMELLRHLHELHTRGAALLSALSRKRFVGALSGEADPAGRLYGTLAANGMAVAGGADIVRVHDVSAHVPYLRAVDGLLRK